MNVLFAFPGLPAPTQLIVLLVLAVLLFGQNLPQVARTLGQKLADFRRGMKHIEDEIRSITSDITSSAPTRPAISNSNPQDYPYNFSQPRDDPSDLDEPTAPKFEPPPG
jgi:sec-independent protein translocase protein TatA